MADLHLIDFYKDTAQALLSLHQSFPRKVELYVEDLIGEDHVDEFGLHSKRHEACLGAFLWLAEEGYIRYHSTIRQEAIDQAILSSKTVVLLGTISTTQFSPEDHSQEAPSFEAQERITMIEHIRRALRSKSSDQLTQVMKTFFEMGHQC
ncbi:MAG: hypothetical protein MI867_26900 [Pseudomonadales bacterium]|nr:hypothetical protein [Pseudomonadales bacterium]